MAPKGRYQEIDCTIGLYVHFACLCIPTVSDSLASPSDRWRQSVSPGRAGCLTYHTWPTYNNNWPLITPHAAPRASRLCVDGRIDRRSLIPPPFTSFWRWNLANIPITRSCTSREMRFRETLASCNHCHYRLPFPGSHFLWIFAV